MESYKMTNWIKHYIKISVISLLLFNVGCTTIPPEAPDLSIELGKRVSAIEQSNITLLHRYFDMKREVVDKFIEEEWIPLFAKELFSTTTMKKNWAIVVKENDATQRLKFLIRTGPKLQKKINVKRMELIKPLDELEREIELSIRTEYHQARAINNTITSFLISASEVSENRDRYLEMINIDNNQTSQIINDVDNAVNKLLKSGNEAKDKIEKSEIFLNKISEIRKKI